MSIKTQGSHKEFGLGEHDTRMFGVGFSHSWGFSWFSGGFPSHPLKLILVAGDLGEARPAPEVHRANQRREPEGCCHVGLLYLNPEAGFPIGFPYAKPKRRSTNSPTHRYYCDKVAPCGTSTKEKLGRATFKDVGDEDCQGRLLICTP